MKPLEAVEGQKRAHAEKPDDSPERTANRVFRVGKQVVVKPMCQPGCLVNQVGLDYQRNRANAQENQETEDV